MATALYSHCLAGILSIALSQAPLDSNSLHEQDANRRNAIVTGELEYEVAYGDRGTGENEIVWRSAAFKDRVIFDRRNGLLMYVERWNPLPATFVNDGKTLVQTDETGGNIVRMIVRPDREYEYTPLPLSDGTRLAVTEFLPHEKRGPLKKVLFPWNFGVIPEIIEDYIFTSYEAVIKTPPDSAASLAEPDLVDGEECLRVEYHTYDNRIVHVWHSPAKGMAIIRIVMQGSNSLGNWRNRLDSKLKSYDDGGVWFPSELVLQSELIGEDVDKQIYLFQRTQVTNAVFNNEINPKHFEVGALQPAPETTIHRDFESDVPIEKWDGEKVVTARLDTRPPTGNPQNPKRVDRAEGWSNKLVLLVIGNVLIIAGAACFFLRKRKSADNTFTERS